MTMRVADRTDRMVPLSLMLMLLTIAFRSEVAGQSAQTQHASPPSVYSPPSPGRHPRRQCIYPHGLLMVCSALFVSAGSGLNQTVSLIVCENYPASTNGTISCPDQGAPIQIVSATFGRPGAGSSGSVCPTGEGDHINVHIGQNASLLI